MLKVTENIYNIRNILHFCHMFDNVTYKSVCINKSVNQCLEHPFFYYILFMMISLAFQM